MPYCRSVLVALPVCIVAVVLIAQPSALFGRTTDNARHVNSLGVAVGVFQVQSDMLMHVKHLGNKLAAAAVHLLLTLASSLGALQAHGQVSPACNDGALR